MSDLGIDADDDDDQWDKFQKRLHKRERLEGRSKASHPVHCPYFPLWDKFQKRLHKRERLEGRSKASHPVHCPYFPLEKQEFWWCYICDRKSHTLLTAPAHCTALRESTELTLRFTAPRWPGLYTLSCCLRSDSYIGMDQQQDMKLDVKEAAAVPAEHPQWDLSDSDSDNNDQGGNESEFTTDDEVDEE
ncbi:sec63 brl domain-containing protein [Phthorimaea operculella]|nr:sec63 brl domain-containing protein [Phthorimaea operculella]